MHSGRAEGGADGLAVCFPQEIMINSRRRLPPWVPDSVPVFVTWRLAGTWPHRVGEAQDGLLSAGQWFACADGDLDRATSGPAWRRDARVAQMVVDALQ